MSDKVKVAVRVRPLNSREIDLGTNIVVEMDETQTWLTHPTAKDRKENTKTFTYDHCFWSMDENNKKFASQEKVYKCLGTDVLTNAFEGYNACLFAYGQTGSGKSYTMMGSSTQAGIIPRLCDDLFERISNNKDENISFKVEVSYIEIYNEKVRDLLNPRGGKQTLKVREHKVTGPYVDGLTKLVVSSFQDIDSLMIEGNKSRTVAATNMNSESSRSHAVFNIVLTQAEFDEETQTTGEKASKLSLVDLAGSERASKTGTTGDRLREGSNINKSLHTLGLVISALADQASGKAKKAFFVPYRDSVLTWLLKDNLGGNSKTVMVATISPAADNYEETMSTLRYADRAKRIVNHAVVNEDPNAKIIRELREEVERLKQILKIKGFSDSKDEIKEKLTESENLMEEFTMSWEEKEKNSEKIKQERQKALEEMGISIRSSGIAVEKNKFYLVNLNADPSLNELLVYYLKERTVVGRHDAVHHTDIQLQGLGILPEHCILEIVDNEVFVTPMPNARTCRNGVVVTEKTLLLHGDRILWGNNHFFRINCPRPPGAVNEPEQLVDYEFAQREICMNDRSSDLSEDALAVLEEKHKIDKEEALVKQRQMYEEKIERMKNEMSPVFRPERTVSLGSFSSSGIGSSRLSVNDDLDNLENERSLEKLKEEVIHANALVREANQLSEEMKRATEFAVTLQIPTSGLSLNRTRAACASEVAIVVKRKNRGTQFWSLDKLSNKIYDMRDTYNQMMEEGSSKVDVDDDLFFEVECHTLIGVANVYLECVFLDVPLDYAAPIISQQGEVCGRLKVQITRVLEDGGKEADAGSVSDDESPDLMDNDESEEQIGISNHDEEISVGQTIAVKVKIIEAFDLPLAYCNYVFCQYEFWDQPNVVELSSPGSKSNSVVFTEEQIFHFEATEEFLEYISDGALSIEIWGNRSKGFGQTTWTPNIEPITTNSEHGWNDLKRKIDLWTEIHELNDQGFFAPVEVNSRHDNSTGGIFQLRQGQSRRIVVGVRPLPKSGSLPVVIETISAVEVGSVCRRDKYEEALDSYQDKDLSILREKLSNSLMKKREYLDEQINQIMQKKDKSDEDRERESWLIDQWVNLTEEKNFLLHPEPGSNVPGSPSNRRPSPGMEKHIPVIFLDLNAEGLHNIDESNVAGLGSSLPFETDDKMKELPVFKYDQKSVCMTVSWDSSVHDSPYLNRATSSSERVYLIIKARIRLSSPLAMTLILRKRICVRIYKRQSLKDSLMKKIWKDSKTRCCVTYELVSHIPRQPGEETEERGNLAKQAAAAVGKNDEEHEIVLEKYHKGISHVEGLLKLDKLRQEVAVKEKLAASGKPLRKFASTPNLLQGSFDLSSVGSKNDSLDVEFGQVSMKKGSPGLPMRHVAVSFDDWDHSGIQDTSILSPTVVGSSTPTNSLETVLEQSAPSSPQPVVKATETSFPYTPEKSSSSVAGSLETEFNDEREAGVPTDEKPLIIISSDEKEILDPLGIIPVSNKLVEIPIELENPDVRGTDLSSSKHDQSNAQFEEELATNLNLLDFETDIDAIPEKTQDLENPTISDVATIENNRQTVAAWSGTLGDGNSLSNSVDSGLHESTDQLLDARDAMDTNGSSGQNRTKRESEGELRLGQIISVGDSKVGTIRYIGTTEFACGDWVGVELELPVGKNDGSVNGKRYFTCKPRYGTFVREDKVTLLNTRPKSNSSNRVTATNRRVSSGSPGTSSPHNNSGFQTRSKARGASSSDSAKTKEMNRRSNILF